MKIRTLSFCLWPWTVLKSLGLNVIKHKMVMMTAFTSWRCGKNWTGFLKWINAWKLLGLYETSINIVPMVAVAAGHQHAWLSENEELHWRTSLREDTLPEVAFRKNSKFLCITYFIKSLICFPFLASTSSWYFHILHNRFYYFVFIYIHL